MNNVSDISKIEDICGASLPHDFHEFLVAGRELPGNAVVDTRGELAYVNHTESTAEILRSYELIEASSLPRSLVPFATDGGGNMFCLSTQSNELGSVFYIDFERESSSMSFKTLIASSFAEFLAKMRSVD